jgi:hypothetical protein
MNDTLYKIMADDINVHLDKDREGTWKLDLEDTEGNIIYSESNIHFYAIESLVDFCEQILRSVTNVYTK